MGDWIIHLIDQGGYWGIALLMVLENVFPPIPSELIMGIGGIRVGQGRMNMAMLLFAGTIGTTIGNYVWFMAGRYLGIERLRPLVRRFGRWLTIEWREVVMLNTLFNKYGSNIVFFMRFMPALRTIISLPAGLFKMGHVRFLVWTTAGALIWNIILASAGYYLGARFTQIDDYLGPATTIMLAVIAVFYLWRLMRWRPEEPRDAE